MIWGQRYTSENEGWLFPQQWEPCPFGSPDPSRANSNPLLPIISRGMGSVGTQDIPSPKGLSIRSPMLSLLSTVSNSMTIQLGGLEPSLRYHWCVCGLYFEKPNIVLHLVFFMCETICWQIGLKYTHVYTRWNFSTAPSNFSPTDSLILLLKKIKCAKKEKWLKSFQYSYF